MSNFFTFFQTCFFSKQCKNYSFNYFLCFHVTVISIIISITLKSNFTKEKRIYKHGYISYIIIICTYSCKKNFIPGCILTEIEIAVIT